MSRKGGETPPPPSYDEATGGADSASNYPATSSTKVDNSKDDFSRGEKEKLAALHIAEAEELSDESEVGEGEEETTFMEAEDGSAEEDRFLPEHPPSVERIASTEQEEGSSLLRLDPQDRSSQQDAGDGDDVVETNIDTGQTVTIDSVDVRVEEGETSAPKERSSRFWLKRNRFLVISVICIGVLLLLGVIILIPVSLEKVEYHQLALKRSRTTGVVDSSRTYQFGCYLIEPDAEFEYFKSSAYTMDGAISIFTRDLLVIDVAYKLQYFLRPSQLGVLWDKFGRSFEIAFVPMVNSEIKNTAASLSVDDIRLNRTRLSDLLHTSLQRRLGGTCCASCCNSHCRDSIICKTCLSSNCDSAYHVDVRFFQLHAVQIPEAITSRFLRQTLLDLDKETEELKQDLAIVKKMTEFVVKSHKNAADEALAMGKASSKLIQAEASAQSSMERQMADVRGWNSLCTSLSLVNEDHQASIYWLRALNSLKANKKLIFHNATKLTLKIGKAGKAAVFSQVLSFS